MKAVQIFSKEALERSKNLTPTQIAEFLEEFRLMHGTVETKSKLISIRVPEHLLNSFKLKCKANRIPYQSKIKELMVQWL